MAGSSPAMTNERPCSRPMPLATTPLNKEPDHGQNGARAKAARSSQEQDRKICACSSLRRASTRISPTGCWPARSKCWTKPAPNSIASRVPGALEVPAAIAIALEAAKAKRAPYDGVVALGCVIQGETYHFDIVSNESARGADEHRHRRNGCRSATASSPSTPRRRRSPAPAARKATRAREAARAALRLAALKRELPATLMARAAPSDKSAQSQQARRRAARGGAGALPDGPRRHRLERDPGRVREPLDRPRGRGRAISAGRGRLLPRHRHRRGARAARARSADRRGAAAVLAAQAHRDGAARGAARRRLRARAPQATCRRAWWWPNMPTSPPPSSSATRPAWSMPCSTSWRGNCARRNSRPRRRADCPRRDRSRAIRLSIARRDPHPDPPPVRGRELRAERDDFRRRHDCPAKTA